MYKPGQWRALCDVCGFKFYSSELKKRWDGLMVCQADFEHDHPQKYLRVQDDKQSIPWARPQGENTFVYVCYQYASQGYAGIGEAGCMRAGIQEITYAQAVALKGS